MVFVVDGEVVLVDDVGRDACCAPARRRASAPATRTGTRRRTARTGRRRSSRSACGPSATPATIPITTSSAMTRTAMAASPAATGGRWPKENRHERDLPHGGGRRRRRRHHLGPARPGDERADRGRASPSSAPHVDAALADQGVKGIVITSAKPDFAGGMDLNLIADIKRRAGRGRRQPGRGDLRQGDGAAWSAAQDRARRHGPEDQQGRQAGRLGLPRHGGGHRARDRAGLPSPDRGRARRRADRPARDPGRPLPRRRRHDAADPHAGADGRGRAAAAGQDVPDRARPLDRADPRGGRRGRRRAAAAARQGLGAEGDRPRDRQALGREGLSRCRAARPTRRRASRCSSAASS